LPHYELPAGFGDSTRTALRGETAMRSLLPLVLVVIVPVAVAAHRQDRPPSSDRQVRANYYPLKVGSKWTYRFEAAGQPAETCTVKAAKIEKFDGVELFRMEIEKKGALLGTEHLLSNERGVFRYRANDIAPSKPICLIKYPVTSGDTWRDEVEVLGNKMVMSFKVDKEVELQVPAGKFKTVPVFVTCEIAGVTFTTTYWFAADVGVVKQAIDLAGTTTLMELEKYEPGK
jgi:hypothetical protein